MIVDNEGITPKLKEILIDMSVNKKDRQEFHREKIADFFYSFLEEHRYITTKALTGDFLSFLGYNVYRGNSGLHNLRRVLSHAFRPNLSKAIKDGRVIKYNTNSYKVV